MKLPLTDYKLDELTIDWLQVTIDWLQVRCSTNCATQNPYMCSKFTPSHFSNFKEHNSCMSIEILFITSLHVCLIVFVVIYFQAVFEGLPYIGENELDWPAFSYATGKYYFMCTIYITLMTLTLIFRWPWTWPFAWKENSKTNLLFSQNLTSKQGHLGVLLQTFCYNIFGRGVYTFR